MKTKFLFLAFLFLTLFFLANKVNAIDPQYIFVRKDPMTCNPSDCRYLWNMDQPDKITIDAINDVYNKVGTHGNKNRKLGIGVQVFYNQYNFNNLRTSLQRLLDYSKVHTVPLFFSLGGFQWWDSNSIGFDSVNKQNVEWTCWDSSCAIKKSWRNWGSEIEIKPHPNLASPEFINNNKQKLSQLIPIIVNWHKGLPDEKKWLFGGMSLGVEVDIGGNYYYYPDGVKTNNGITDSVQLGYAAVKTAGIRSSGSAPTTKELNQVVRSYFTQLNKLAIDLGVPRNKLFTHTSADDFSQNSIPDWISRPDSHSALNSLANPGWSFYGNVTRQPGEFSGLASNLNTLDNSEWASPEWLTWAQNENDWVDALRSSLSYRNNRLINISNWEGIRNKGYVLNALNRVLQEKPACWVSSPKVKTVESGNQVNFSWQKGSNNQAVYLNISNKMDFAYSGQFKQINIANQNVTDLTTWQKVGLAEGKYYWQLVADGCSNQRRRVNGSFVISSTVSCQICSTGLPKSQGNADCNNSIDLIDFASWLNVFKSGADNGEVDFNCQDGDSQHSINIADFNVWLDNFTAVF